MIVGEINIVAVALATLGSFFVGFLWYGVIFKNTWMKAMGIKKENTDKMGKLIIQNQSFNFIGIAVLFYILKQTNITEVPETLRAIILLWAAFCVPSIMAGIIWERRSHMLGFLNTGAFLAQSLVAGIILSKWL